MRYSKTTREVREAVKLSQASLSQLSRELGINPKTVSKWRKRASVDDLKSGPSERRSSVLTELEEAVAVAFRYHTMLPLDDCLIVLQRSIPSLRRSTLHRCLVRHGVSNLRRLGVCEPGCNSLKRTSLGLFRVDVVEMQFSGVMVYLFVGIDQASKFATAQLVKGSDDSAALEFIGHLIETVPFRVHSIASNSGKSCPDRTEDRYINYAGRVRFDTICESMGIEHLLRSHDHVWTSEQIELVGKKTFQAAGKLFPNYTLDQLRNFLAYFISNYNFACRLNTLDGLTPYSYLCKVWTSDPDRFILDPINGMPGLTTLLKQASDVQ